MTSFATPAMAVSFCLATLLLPGSALAAPTPFDGRWAVVLSCPDTTDQKGLVKGYQYTFPVSIEEGVVQGRYGAPGHPASVVYGGTVRDDGLLEINATGNTGQSEYSVGKVVKGTQYSYTMQGKLSGSAGQASRRELRPCTATFQKY